MTNEQKILHKKNTSCIQCNCSYTLENKKIRHHNHINGQFISSLCNECNLKMQYKPFLPVYLHNLKGYDSHLFITALFKYGYQQTEKTKKDFVSCIPNNEQKYISFSKNIIVDTIEFIDKKSKKMIRKPVFYEIRFLDSYAFMASSIDELSENLKSSCNNNIIELRNTFKNISEHFINDDEFLLLIQKGVYPYDYIDSYDRLYEDKLPSQSDFYSELSSLECSNENYEKAKLVWNTFKCKNFLDYHNIYLISDVLLLADIWENFRNVCYKIYGLDRKSVV